MTGFCPIADANVRDEHNGEDHDAWRDGAIAHEEYEEHHHRQEREDGFRVMDRSQRKVSDQDGGLNERHEVEDQPQSDCRLHNLGQNIALFA